MVCDRPDFPRSSVAEHTNGAPAKSTADAVTICMCTYRRPAAFEALASFETLSDLSGDVRVVVIDNDDTDILRAQFEDFAKRYSYPLQYVHAPARNISIARNAALDATDTRWMAFIDDDETADPRWLATLLQCRDRGVAIIGQCIAVYGAELPSWAARCDFHSNRIRGDAANAYTSNALLDMDFVRRHTLRFRVELGLTGGEDSVFFRQMKEAGGMIAYCPEAVVYEPVPPQRATMSWVRRRMYRAGQTHGLLCREFDRTSYRHLWLTAGAKAAFSAMMAIATLPGSDASRRWYARAMLHAGAARYRIRPAMLEEYA